MSHASKADANKKRKMRNSCYILLAGEEDRNEQDEWMLREVSV